MGFGRGFTSDSGQFLRLDRIIAKAEIGFENLKSG